MPRAKVIWGNLVNLSGLYSDRPVRLKWDPEFGNWWSADGNMAFCKLGEHRERHVVMFASKSRRDVALWTKGVKAMAHRIGCLVG